MMQALRRPAEGLARRSSGVLSLRFGAKTLIYFQVVYVLAILFLKDALGLPDSVLYLTDVVTLLAIASCPKGSWSRFRRLENTGILVVFFVFCAALALGDVLHAVRPLLVLWAVRNTFRFFAFLYACASLLERRDIRTFFNIFFVAQCLNLVLSLVQYAQGYGGDHNGGIFGTQVGCNGYTNVFFCLIFSYYALAYSDGREPLAKFLFIAASALIIAALAELKIYYIEAVVIVLFAFFCRAGRVRSFGMLAIGVVAFVVALQVFSQVFPDAYRMLTDFDSLMSYSTDNTGAVEGYNISRLNAFSDINEFIFHDDVALNLLGVGFGNAGYSSYSFLTSDFYLSYGYLNYFFFTHQNWFIETGYVGFGLLVALFLSLFFYCGKWAKRIPEDSFYFRLCQLVVLLTILCFWYNQTLRVEAAYLTFLVLAIPFVIVASRKDEGEVETHGTKRYL